LRDESEWWELTRRTEQRIDATYRRKVTVRSPDGAVIACAAAPSWSFDDAYVLDGQREEEHWHFYERPPDPPLHPRLHPPPPPLRPLTTAPPPHLISPPPGPVGPNNPPPPLARQNKLFPRPRRPTPPPRGGLTSPPLTPPPGGPKKPATATSRCWRA